MNPKARKRYISLVLAVNAVFLLVVFLVYLRPNDTQEAEVPSPEIGQATPAAPQGPPVEPGNSTRITAEVARAMMEDGGDFVLIDVRTPEEFANEHIFGAINIPVDMLQEAAAQGGDGLEDLDGRILLYCRTGRRSAQGADILVEQGFLHVYDFGGLNDWPFETTTLD